MFATLTQWETHGNRFGECGSLRRQTPNQRLRCGDQHTPVSTAQSPFPTRWGRSVDTTPKSGVVMETIPGLLESAAAWRPEHPMFLFGGRTFTYAEINSDANRLGHALRGPRVAADAPVAALMPSRPMFASVYYGIQKVGAHRSAPQCDVSPRRDRLDGQLPGVDWQSSPALRSCPWSRRSARRCPTSPTCWY